MFIFGKEKEFVDYIIFNKDNYPELKDKKIIGEESYYGSYIKKKDRTRHSKICDLVFLDRETLYFCEVRCGYISPELVDNCTQAIGYKAFFEKVKVLFIGTKISDKTKEKFKKEYSNIDYYILEDVKYVQGYKSNKEILKRQYEKNIELETYNFLNNCRSRYYYEDIHFSGYNIKSYNIINDKKIELCFKTFKKHYLKITIDIRSYYNEYIIEVTENNSNIAILKKKTKLSRFQLFYIVYNLFCFLNNNNDIYLDNKKMENIFHIIVYSSFNKDLSSFFKNDEN